MGFPGGSGVPQKGSYLRVLRTWDLGSRVLDIPGWPQRAIATDIRGTGDPGDSSLGHDPGGVKSRVQNGVFWGSGVPKWPYLEGSGTWDPGTGYPQMAQRAVATDIWGLGTSRRQGPNMGYLGGI